MIGFEVLRPSLAWLFVLAPLAGAAGWLALARSRAELTGWVAEARRARFLPGFSTARARLRLVCGSAGLAFLALALVGPVRGHTYRAVSRKGLDLVLCLDTSRSMLAQDLRPSRLERAKREIKGLLDHLTGDRVALVAFSGDARDITPLTRDRGTLTGLLAHVTPDDNQKGGTDLAAALARALALFDGRTGAHEAIVLLTDGEDLGGQAAAQAEEAAKRGIRVFVVGIGTEAGGKIPIAEAGGRTGFLEDEDGQEVVTRLERETLVTLAARTGGDYLSAEEAPTALEDLYGSRISRLSGREVEGGERRVPYDRFQWPLALALLCLVLELLVRVQRRARESAPSGTLLAAALLPFLVLGQEPFSTERSLAEALRAHGAGELDAAEAAARAVLEHAATVALPERDQARAHFALGLVAATRALAHPEEGEPARAAAREGFSAARALAGPGELRLDATYDLGALELLRAEEVRATIPEISGGTPTSGAAPLGIPGLPGQPPAQPESDPMKEARALYQAARGWFVERLRLDWEDEDTRANLELIQRRLHELDEIEKKREEQRQDQQDQDPSKDQNQDEQSQKDEQEQDPEKQDPDQKGKDPKDQDEPPRDESKDPSQQEEEQKEPDEQSEKPEEEPRPPQPEEGQEGEKKDGAPPPPAEPPSERVLTREEVMQLLDKLAELEEKQKAFEAALRARQRAKTKRDW